MTAPNLSRNLHELDDPDDIPRLRRKAIVLLLLTVVLWSSSGVFVKIIGWGPFSILSARSMVATAVFLIYLRHLNLRWTLLQIAGDFGYIGAQLFFIMGTKLAAAANVIFLAYTSPLYIVFFGHWFLEERPQRADWVSMPVIFSGMLLFFGDDLSLDGLRGNVFGALSGMSMAVMVLCMRRQKVGVPANTILLGNLIGILIGLPSLLHETFSVQSVGIILYLGIFQLGLSFIFYSIAIKHVQALESTLILTLEPILNPLWVFLGIGEVPGQLAFFGCLLVLGAVVGRAMLSARRAAADVPLGR